MNKKELVPITTTITIRIDEINWGVNVPYTIKVTPDLIAGLTDEQKVALAVKHFTTDVLKVIGVLTTQE